MEAGTYVNNNSAPILMESRVDIPEGSAEGLPRTKRLRYVVRILRERPGLSAIAISFLYYPLFLWVVKERKLGMKNAVAATGEAIARGDAAKSAQASRFFSKNSFVIDQIQKCENATEAIVALVDYTLGQLRRQYRRSKNEDAKKALRVLSLFNVNTGETPYSERQLDYKRFVFALEYVALISQGKYDDLYKNFRDARNALMEDAYLYHSTEHLLEYYQLVLSEEDVDTLSKDTPEAHELLKKLALDHSLHKGDDTGRLSLSDSVIWLVSTALSSLVKFDVNADGLYKSIAVAYISPASLTQMLITDIGDPWNGNQTAYYRSKRFAMNILESLIWGVSTNDILDACERKKRSERDLEEIAPILRIIAQNNYSPKRGWSPA